jgi:8-oxo-dGTP pyrophosphatase MutT (NUDIX family)
MTNSSAMDRNTLMLSLSAYKTADPTEQEHLQRITAFVSAHINCCDRNLTVGHITASCWIVDESFEYALLTHHRKLKRWLQLGGHVEDDGDILSAALREAREESGLTDIHPVAETIFDVDAHTIPARKQEAEHIHYDIRFLFQARKGQQLIISDESHDLRWFSIPELQQFPADASIDRMVKKMATTQQR